MRTRAFPTAPRWGLTLRCLTASAVLVTALALSTTAIAQSFLGSIRGTVVDSSGGAVPKAAVLVTDEATGVPRSVDTDAEGRYEASNLKPGTYRVEVLTTNFKKFEKTGVVVRASATALVDITLEVGAVSETVTGHGRRPEQHHARQRRHLARSRRAAAARPAAQQPRHAVVPAAQPQRRRRQRHGHPVPGRQDVRRLVHPGRAGVDERDLRHGRQLRAGSRRGSKSSRCCRTRTVPNTVASRASWSRPSAAATRITAPASTTSTATA